MASTPRIDQIEAANSGLSVALQTPVVNLTYLTAVNGAPGAGQFRSTITGRGRMVDLSNDLMPRMGIERIPISQYLIVPGESGPNGEPVRKMVNDKYDQIRFVGGWQGGIEISTIGQGAGGITAADYVEITFYGTGLNILQAYNDATERGFAISVDGAAETTLSVIGSTVSSVRNYNSNIIRNVASNLTLGIHTIKLRQNQAAGCSICGFEIVNESSSIKTATGTSSINGKLLTLSALNSQAYNSSFDSGTLGTRGGRVVVYQKSDGTIGKSVQPTNASSATLASTDHSNEEVVRTYHPREFGAGRATTDDFSSLISAASNRAFTLDDGTTNLYGINLSFTEQSAVDCLLGNGAGLDPFLFTFVGTGLDVMIVSTGGARTDTVIVNGVAAGSIVQNTVAGVEIKKIVSGLPYGTHQIRFTSGAGAGGIRYAGFTVYGPKKPTLPSGAVELADYNIMANYVPGTIADVNGIATGVLRKSAQREFNYTGTGWAIGGVIVMDQSINGFHQRTSTNGDSVSVTFFGTGFEWRLRDADHKNITILVDGSISNFTSYTNGKYGTGTWTPATGSWTNSGGSNGGNGIYINGLPLGIHTVKVTGSGGSTFLYADAIDIVTPIHVHKNNGPFIVQNTLAIGSGSINDGRKFSSNQLVIPSSACQTKDISSTVTNTTGSSYPVIDTTTTIKTNGGMLHISAMAQCGNTGGHGGVKTRLMVNGILVGTEGYWQHNTGTTPDGYGTNTMSVIMSVPAGWHTVQMYFYAVTAVNAQVLARSVTVKEI